MATTSASESCIHRGSTTKLVLPWFPTVVEQVSDLSSLMTSTSKNPYHQRLILPNRWMNIFKGCPKPFPGTCATVEASVRTGGEGPADQGRGEPGRGEQEGFGRVEHGRGEQEDQYSISEI